MLQGRQPTHMQHALCAASNCASRPPSHNLYNLPTSTHLHTHKLTVCSYWSLCEDLLQPGELAWLRDCDNPPVKVLAIMSGLVKR